MLHSNVPQHNYIVKCHLGNLGWWWLTWLSWLHNSWRARLLLHRRRSKWKGRQWWLWALWGLLHIFLVVLFWLDANAMFSASSIKSFVRVAIWSSERKQFLGIRVQSEANFSWSFSSMSPLARLDFMESFVLTIAERIEILDFQKCCQLQSHWYVLVACCSSFTRHQNSHFLMAPAPE